MKSFIQYLLEFDPNRGAKGRAIPKVFTGDEIPSHYRKNFMGVEAKRRGLNTTGKKSRIIGQLSPEERERYDTYTLGRYFPDKFYGSALSANHGNDGGYNYDLMRAHQAGIDAANDPEVRVDRERVEDAPKKVIRSRNTGTFAQNRNTRYS